MSPSHTLSLSPSHILSDQSINIFKRKKRFHAPLVTPEQVLENISYFSATPSNADVTHLKWTIGVLSDQLSLVSTVCARATDVSLVCANLEILVVCLFHMYHS